MRRSLTLALIPLSLTAAMLTSCSSENKDAVTAPGGLPDGVTLPDVGDITIPDVGDITIPDLGDVTIPDLGDITIPDIPNLSEDCEAAFAAFIAAGSAFAGQGSLPDNLDTFADLVPEELRDDALVWAKAFTELADILAKYDGDFQAAITSEDGAEVQALFSDPEVQEAGDNLSDYFNENCSGQP